MFVEPKILPCGYRVIPFIVNRKYNKQLESLDAERSFKTLNLMQNECTNDRLAKNYIDDLRLDQMSLYSVLWDEANDKPVLTTGAHHISLECVRLFTRYYLFKNYRTTMSNGLFAKIDNFETDFFHKNLLFNQYPFLFWSRDKSPAFFKKISKIQLFKDWKVYPHKVAITKAKNMQYIMYTGIGKKNPKIYIDQLLSNK
jgi:hypothetical protein